VIVRETAHEAADSALSAGVVVVAHCVVPLASPVPRSPLSDFHLALETSPPVSFSTDVSVWRYLSVANMRTFDSHLCPLLLRL
jgi:hypothetical protein